MVLTLYLRLIINVDRIANPIYYTYASYGDTPISILVGTARIVLLIHQFSIGLSLCFDSIRCSSDLPVLDNATTDEMRPLFDLLKDLSNIFTQYSKPKHINRAKE